jgi:hypothetical protein
LTNDQNTKAVECLQAFQTEAHGYSASQVLEDGKPGCFRCGLSAEEQDRVHNHRRQMNMAALPQIVPAPLRLNLGCSDSHLKGYVNVDLCEPCDLQADLDRPWPWPDSSVQEIKAWDIFEHLPSKLHTMNEAWRVLKPGGQLDLLVPTTDGRGAFQDPTHTSFWTPNDLFYFCDRYGEWRRFRVSYGITAHFRLISQTHEECPNRVWKLRAILEAIKP